MRNEEGLDKKTILRRSSILKVVIQYMILSGDYAQAVA